MKETLKRDLNKTYLILSSDSGEYEEAYELEMIIKNTPRTLLPLHVMRMDGETELFYDITSKQTLREFMLRGNVPGSMVRELFTWIVRMEREMKNCLLDTECILFDPEHIYKSGEQFCFCYCPWQKNNVQELLHKLLEELLGKLDYGDTVGIELAYHLYQQSCAGYPDIEKVLEEHTPEGRKENHTEKRSAEIFLDEDDEPQEDMENNFVAEDPDGNARQKEVCGFEKKGGFLAKLLRFFVKKEEQTEEEQEKYPDAWEEINKLKIPGESEECFGFAEASAAYEASSTVLLSRISAGEWRLRPLVPGYEEFRVTGESFLVGKNKGVVDGYIGRETISRIHSRMYVKEGRLFIADANSTNGTFVNGEQLPPGTDAEIFSGDRVLFADVGYECYNSL